MKGWADSGDLSYSDIPDFIESACTVLATIDSVDFGLVEDGKEARAEIVNNAIAIIRKGLDDILSIE